MRANPANRAAVALLGRAQGQHLAGVRVGRAGFGQQVVAVVPQRDQAEVLDGGERGGPVADDDTDLAAQGAQEGAVAGGGPRLGHQDREPGGPQGGGASAPELLEVALVGDDEDRAAAAVDGGPGGGGQPGGPVAARVGAGRHLPGGPGAAPGGQRRQEPRARRVGAERVGRRRRRGRRRPRDGRRVLGGRVPRWHGEPHHVAEAAGVVVGDASDQARDLRRQHRLGGDHLAERAERPVVVAGLPPLEQEAVPLLAGEPHPHPGTGNRLRVLGARDRVVEGPVEVAERQVEDDTADGADLGRRVRWRVRRRERAGGCHPGTDGRRSRGVRVRLDVRPGRHTR